MRDGENGVHRGASETECHEVPQTFPLHVNALAISGSGAAEWAFSPPFVLGSLPKVAGKRLTLSLLVLFLPRVSPLVDAQPVHS